MLTVNNLSVDGFKSAIHPINLSIDKGDWVLVKGNVGSGKTNLLLTLGGLIRPKSNRGSVEWGDIDIYDYRCNCSPQVTSYISSRPDFIFSGLTTTLENEITLFTDTSTLDTSTLLQGLINDFNVSHLLSRDITSLSGGERTRAAYVIALIQRPGILLLDQAIEWLDISTKSFILDNLIKLQKSGLIIIEATARRLLNDNPTVTIDLEQYVLSNISNNVTSHNEPNLVYSDCKLNVTSIVSSYESSNFKLGPVSASVSSGESVAVIGINGAGKTTLLRSLGLLLPIRNGSIYITSDKNGKFETHVSADYLKNQHKWSRHVLYSFQEPDDQLFCATVRDELNFTAHNTQSFNPFPIEWIASAFSINDILEKSPLSLPRGLRKIVLIASLIIARPKILLLDEPTAELDEIQVTSLKHVLDVFMKLGGCCLIVSHDDVFVSDIASRIFHIESGKLISDDFVRQ